MNTVKERNYLWMKKQFVHKILLDVNIEWYETILDYLLNRINVLERKIERYVE